MTYTYECPNCHEELHCEVDVGEHIVDFPDQCDNCGRKVTEEDQNKHYSDALSDCLGNMVDHAHDTMKDKCV